MSTLEQLNLSQPLTDVYTAMETDIMMAIARQLARDGEISSTSEWRMKKLAESGALSRETAQIIASYTGIQSDLLMLTIEQAAVKVTNKLEPALQAVAKDGFIELKDSTPISAGMKNVVSNFRRQARSDLNLVNTVMQYKANSSYTYLVNKVYTETVENRQELLAALGKHTFEVASGAETRQTAIRNCIKEFAQKGIPAFVDRAGREWSPEAYISMDIRTTVGNTANAAQDACCNRYGIDLYVVSSHMGARPKCAPYQGKVVSRSDQSGIAHDGDGNEVPFIPQSSTSYGEPDGLFGINCGHNKYPFIDGVSFQRYYPYDEEANAARYKEFQQQRALERKVRTASREVDMMKEQNDPEGLKAARENLKQLWQEYSKYSADHGLKEHNDRASVVRIRKGDDVFGKIYKSPIKNVEVKGGFAETKVIAEDIKSEIVKSVEKIQSEYTIKIDEISFETLSKEHGKVPFQFYPVNENGLYKSKLIINQGFDWEKDLDSLNERIYNKNYIKNILASQNTSDLIAHEIAHIISFQDCETYNDFIVRERQLRTKFIAGVSGYSDSKEDGSETLSEGFVRIRNGETVDDRVKDLVNTYIERWKKDNVLHNP